ncbi:hypothetical protein [Streptomyces fructofermentans]|uniref:hypothetical protein n=1 Tax=Streptomyces fructofermentans TaxID=152141 RepID=UPI00379FB146
MVNVVVEAGKLLEALNAVAWDRLGAGGPADPVQDVPRALRRLVSAGPEAKEEHCRPLHSLVTRDGDDTPPAAAAALPFVIALAADSAMGARTELVDVLASMWAPALAGEDWSGAWALLGDPDPAVRRAATAMPVGLVRLLARWRTETDPAVRVPLLLAIGAAAASGTGGTRAVDRARAVLAEVPESDDPVLWVAAVHASAGLDPGLPVRRLDRLIEVFSDLALRPRFEEVWYDPAVEGHWTREDVVRSTSWLLRHEPGAELAFAVRLASGAQVSGDAPLCREALDAAWHVLTERRSAEAALLPLAGGLLTDPDGAVRLRAANILAALGRASAPYADRLAELLDDDAADEYLDGTVREYARWALARIDDPRALPGLIEQLHAQEEEQGRGYVIGEPRRPEARDVLIPLRARADVLLPAMREAIGRGGVQGRAARVFLEVLDAWGVEAPPPAPPGLPRTAPCGSGDREAALRTVGEAVRTAEPPGYGPIGSLAGFGRDAAPYADAVRDVMERTTHWPRLTSAIALWEITGRAEPSMRVLEEFVLPIADGGDGFGFFREALPALVRMDGISPAIRAALTVVRDSERRLSADGGYPMVLQDEELRGLVEQALACADHGPVGTGRSGP